MSALKLKYLFGSEHTLIPSAELRTLRSDLEKAERELRQLFIDDPKTIADLRARLRKFDDPKFLHAHCVRNLTDAQVAHLFGERMTKIVNENAALRDALAPFARRNLSFECYTTDLLWRSPEAMLRQQADQIAKEDREILAARAALGGGAK